ncbi:hypothetical protein DXG03_008510 [Asterophora parasitica]|uniref:Uncharacterized protein n=1 Tax=Asterophora parasitica TaxID=117018 RepID=A0A9P7GIU0_9AGAR|nr:hypothetical protein DXG03_008510 [Asterophora parasitica]
MQNPSQIIQPPLLDFSLATFPDIPFTNHFDTTSFTTGVSQSQGLDTMTNSDFSWFVPPPFEHHDAFGSMDKLPDFGQTLVQDPSLVFVGTIPGMATLATGSIVTQQQVEDKAGMERRLAEMKEAMRSLEEKIAQSS